MSNVQQFYAFDTGTVNNFFSGLWMLTRCMKQAGWTYQGSGDGNATKDTSATAASDLWGGGATPTSDTYPTAFSARGTNNTAGPWICLRGPDIVKLAIGAASTGTFLRGEVVTQSTSGATGEITGYVFDATNLGWVVIKPQTGTFDGTHVITGALSGATVTATAVTTYRQEIVFWKNAANVQLGSAYYVVDVVGSANLFSALMTQSGCTATVAPGGGGTANAFPTTGISVIGSTTGTTTPTLSASSWFAGTTSSVSITITTHVLLSAVNATPAANVSADGTFWGIITNTGNSTNSNLMGLFLLDDGEPGDVNPYAWHYIQGQSNATYSRLNTNVSGALTSESWLNFTSVTNTVWQGWLAKGTGFATDIPSYFQPSQLARGTSSIIVVQNVSDLMKVQNHPATTKPMSVDTVVLFNDKTGQEMIKGRPRWMRLMSIGTLYDTTDAKTWVCCLTNVSTTNPAVYVGPWDGSTVPAP